MITRKLSLSFFIFTTTCTSLSMLYASHEKNLRKLKTKSELKLDSFQELSDSEKLLYLGQRIFRLEEGNNNLKSVIQKMNRELQETKKQGQIASNNLIVLADFNNQCVRTHYLQMAALCAQLTSKSSSRLTTQIVGQTHYVNSTNSTALSLKPLPRLIAIAEWNNKQLPTARSTAQTSSDKFTQSDEKIDSIINMPALEKEIMPSPITPSYKKNVSCKMSMTKNTVWSRAQLIENSTTARSNQPANNQLATVKRTSKTTNLRELQKKIELKKAEAASQEKSI